MRFKNSICSLTQSKDNSSYQDENIIKHIIPNTSEFREKPLPMLHRSGVIKVVKADNGENSNALTLFTVLERGTTFTNKGSKTVTHNTYKHVSHEFSSSIVDVIFYVITKKLKHIKFKIRY